MSGHGWVIPNEDGIVARCGGPAICPECALELAQNPAPPPPVAEIEVEVQFMKFPDHSKLQAIVSRKTMTKSNAVGEVPRYEILNRRGEWEPISLADRIEKDQRLPIKAEV